MNFQELSHTKNQSRNSNLDKRTKKKSQDPKCKAPILSSLVIEDMTNSINDKNEKILDEIKLDANTINNSKSDSPIHEEV